MKQSTMAHFCPFGFHMGDKPEVSLPVVTEVLFTTQLGYKLTDSCCNANDNLARMRFDVPYGY
jgi:hypothetical protein